MKFLLAILFPFLLSAQDGHLAHNIAGCTIAVSTSFVLYKFTHNCKWACVLGAQAAFVSGPLKEHYDAKNGGVKSNGDILATWQGGATGVYISFTGILTHEKRKHPELWL